MADEQTVPTQRGDAGADEAPAVNSGSEASVGRRKPSSGRSAGWWAIRVVVVVVVVAVVGLMYLVSITLNPDSGPEGFKVLFRRRYGGEAPVQGSQRRLGHRHRRLGRYRRHRGQPGRAPQGRHQR